MSVSLKRQCHQKCNTINLIDAKWFQIIMCLRSNGTYFQSLFKRSENREDIVLQHGTLEVLKMYRHRNLQPEKLSGCKKLQSEIRKPSVQLWRFSKPPEFHTWRCRINTVFPWMCGHSSTQAGHPKGSF
jgi:hypothetical protein